MAGAQYEISVWLVKRSWLATSVVGTKFTEILAGHFVSFVLATVNFCTQLLLDYPLD